MFEKPPTGTSFQGIPEQKCAAVRFCQLIVKVLFQSKSFSFWNSYHLFLPAGDTLAIATYSATSSSYSTSY